MTQPSSAPPKTAVRRGLRRFGCGVLLVLWFGLLLTPCALLFIASTGELALPLGGLPEQELRAWLVTEADQRGFGISTGAPASQSETALCMQTDIRFLLWAGRSDPLTYCDCYVREDSADAWALATVNEGACPGAPMAAQAGG